MNMERYKRTVSGALYVNLTLVVCYVPYTVTVAVSTVYGKTSENVSYHIMGASYETKKLYSTDDFKKTLLIL